MIWTLNDANKKFIIINKNKKNYYIKIISKLGKSQICRGKNASFYFTHHYRPNQIKNTPQKHAYLKHPSFFSQKCPNFLLYHDFSIFGRF